MQNGKHFNTTSGRKLPVLLISLILLLTLVVGTTIAFIIDRTEGVVNKFTPGTVACEITEEFDNSLKKNVNVINTGGVSAYVRVKLVTYRVNESGQTIGGSATIPSFDLGEGWFEQDGFYYYSKPVPSQAEPAADLIGAEGIQLISYTDADGGRQAVEVMAEAIQSDPIAVVAETWLVTASQDGTLSPGGNE